MEAASPRRDRGHLSGRGTAIRPAVLWPIVALVVVVALGLVVGLRGGDRDGLERARTLVADADRWTTAEGAAATLAGAAELLLGEARRCQDRAGSTPSCEARAAAAGYSEVLALHLLGCTAPGRFEARQATVAYLDAIAEVTDGPLPRPPALPDC